MNDVRCRSCGCPLSRTFLDLGSMPLANSYLPPGADLVSEPSFPLHVLVCDACLLVQSAAAFAPEALFSEYAYFSSYSTSWVGHARRFAKAAAERFDLGPETLVVEVASNDGYLLRHFLDLGVPVLGVEPAANVAAAARETGVETLVRFFGESAARDLVADRRRPDLVVANNVVAHVPDLNDFLAGFALLLGERGVASFEFPHLANLMREVQFDTIYHEHFSYFSLLSLEAAFARHGLAAFDVEQLPTHGGSLRVLAAPTAAGRPEEAGLLAVRRLERELGLDDPATYDGFAPAVERCRESLLTFLRHAREAGKVVAGYGAAAKGNTLLNFCDVGPEDVRVVADRSPHKQGYLLPGSHIPVVSPDDLDELKPDYLLILPWNLTDEIVTEMGHLRDRGCQFVVAIPEVREVG